MKINNVEVVGNKFAYDGCHKIYIIEDEQDEQKAIDCGYEILDISKLVNTYKYSCELRFIHNWKLTKTYVAQFENATFEVNGQTYEFVNDEDDDEWY
jgi:hypothetical protein